MARDTWAQIKEEAINELRSRTDINQRVERWLREAYQEIAYGYRFYELEKSIDFVLSVNAEDITFAKIWRETPVDLKHVFSIRNTTDGRRLTKSNFRRIDMLSIGGGTPTEYCRFGSSFLFNAIPQNTGIEFRLRYRKQIGEPVYVGNTYPETPAEWDEIIRLKAVARGFEALFEPDMSVQKINIVNTLIAGKPIDEYVESEDERFGLTPRME